MDHVVAVDGGRDLAVEVIASQRRGVDLAGQNQSQAGAPRHLDGEMLPFVRADTGQAEEVRLRLIAFPNREVAHGYGIGDGADPRERRCRSPLAFADGGQSHVAAQRLIESAVRLA